MYAVDWFCDLGCSLVVQRKAKQGDLILAGLSKAT